MTRRAFAIAFLAACAEFDPPPAVAIVGEQGGVLRGWGDPLALRFSEPIAADTLRLAVMHLDLDPERRLPDEDGDPATEPRVLLAHDGADPARDAGATFALDGDARLLRIVPAAPLPLGAPLVLVVEPGLADRGGQATAARIRVPLSYRVDCAKASGAPALRTGPYVFLMSIDPPPQRQQLQLFTWLTVDAATGAVVGQFTDGDRLAALDGRPGCPACDGGQVCRLRPAPDCVAPSLEMGTLDEYVDFLPVVDPPDGFTFSVRACAEDQGNGATVLVTEPFDIAVTIGGTVVITTRDTEFVGEFRRDAGALRGAGSVTVGDVAINDRSSGPTQGAFGAMALSDEELAEIEAWGTAIARPPEE